VGEPVPVRFRRQQRADQVIRGFAAPPLQQRGHVPGQLDDGSFDLAGLVLQRPDVELPLHPVGPLVQLRRVLRRRAEDRGDGQRGVWLGHSRDEFARASRRDIVPQPPQEFPHRWPPAAGGARREGLPYQRPEPAVLLAALIQDVGVDVLPQRTSGYAEEVGQLPAREGGVP